MGAAVDGVKTDLAHHLLIKEKEAGSRTYVRSSAAVLPAESNARARMLSYQNALHGCADEMRGVMKSWAMPRNEARQTTIERRRLRLPVEGFALQTITRFGEGRRYFHYTDVYSS
jgi:hypothetical protein